MPRRCTSYVAFLALVLPAASFSQVIEKNRSTAKEELHRQIESSKISGGAHLVVHHGRVAYFEVAGVTDVEDQTPLKTDTIMRIYSMTKPITSVTAMTLYEQGKFQLDDPIAKYLPAFEKINVLVKESNSYQVMSAARLLTIRDLFRHTTGYSYGRDNPEVLKRYKNERMLYRPPHEMMPPEMTIAEAANGLARIPTLHQPGERFTYGYSTDLLGRLIEVWSGLTLDVYMKQAVFDPLEMVDTDFLVPERKRGSFSSCHAWEDGKLVVADKAGGSPFNEGFEFLSGGGGLVSTMQDYANFCQMIVDGGKFKGNRVLKESSINLMFTDQLNGVAGNFRFGLGFAIDEVTLGSGDQKRTATSYHWGGYANTAFRLVPEAKLFQVFMRQTVPSTHHVANKLFSIVFEGVN